LNHPSSQSESSPSRSPQNEFGSYIQTGSLTRTNNQSKRQLIQDSINRSDNQSHQLKTASLDSTHNNPIRVGGQSLEEPSAITTQNLKFSSRIGHEDISKVEEMCVKLETQERMINRLDEQERGLIQKLK
jgi:hypothetical protein